MRKIVLFIASSLDGYIARENGCIDWLFMDGDYGYRDFYSSVDTVLMGRKTYEISVSFGDTHKGKKVYVFTRKKLKNHDNVEFINEVVPFAGKLLKSKGKNIWLVGGAEIVTILLNNNLVDEIVLSIHPILLGSGIPLFKGIAKTINLSLSKTKVYKNGLVQLTFSVKK